MLTFHGSVELKAQRIAQVRAHRLADQLVHGQYWRDGKGCAIACTIHSGRHEDYEPELGIPVELAYEEDNIFESLPNGQSLMWPERFLEAIPVGVDLRATHVNKRYVLALLTDETRGWIRLIKGAESLKLAHEVVAHLKQRVREPSPTAAPEAVRRLAYRAFLVNLVDQVDLVDRADRACLDYRDYLAYLAGRAYDYLDDLDDDLDYRAEILLEVLAASAPSTSSASLAAAGERG